MPARRTAAVLAVALVADTLTAADWPRWRGPNHDGVSTETGLLKAWPKGGPKLVWTADLGGVGYSSPVVAGGRLYITAAEDPDKGQKEYAVAVNVTDGKEVWRVPLGVGGGDYSGGWGSGPRSTPTIDGDTLYVLGARGDLTALNTADGSAVWAVNLVKDFGGKIPSWGYSDAPLVDGDKLVVTPGGQDGTVLALDKKTGKKVWQSAGLTDGAAYSSLVPTEVGGVRQYVTQTDGAAVGVRASDGKLLWRVAELGRAVAVIPTPVVHDGDAFFTAGYGAGCQLLKLEPDGDGTKATVVYTKNKLVANHHGGVVRVGDHLYGHTDSGGRWVCFDYKKGGDKPVWESRKLDKGSVVAADGRLYCYGERNGTVALVAATPDEEWQETGRFEIPKKSKFPRKNGLIWTHPVVANGKLYLRDHEHLFCYDVAAK